LGAGKYRKRPVVIEARQLQSSRSLAETIAAWCGGRLDENEAYQEPSILISTLEGTMRADPGDWIIKGVQGEFYPCKPDIFEQTYEAAE
jgi:hypothetical protein